MKYNIINLISELKSSISSEDIGEILYNKVETALKDISLSEDDWSLIDYRCYVPEDYKIIPDEKDLINNIIKETLEKCNETLSLENIIVIVLPTFDAFTLEQMNGCGGFAPFGGSSIIISLNTNTQGWQLALAETIAHEYHHVVVHKKNDWKSLGDTFVYEGLAEHFRESILGGEKATFVKYNSRETCLKYWDFLKLMIDDESEELYRGVFFGDEKHPQWLGYSLGYNLVSAYQDIYKEDWKKITERKTKEILDILVKENIFK